MTQRSICFISAALFNGACCTKHDGRPFCLLTCNLAAIGAQVPGCHAAAQHVGSGGPAPKLWSSVLSNGRVWTEQVTQLAQQQDSQQSGAAAEDVASLKVQVEAHALTGAREASEVARQLGALESAQHVTGAEVAAAQARLRLLSDGLAQANIALADVQDTLEESGMASSSRCLLQTWQARCL